MHNYDEYYDSLCTLSCTKFSTLLCVFVIETIESSGIGDFSSPTPPSANNPERKSDAEPHYDDISQQHHASTPPPSSTPAIIYPGLAGLLVHPLIDSFSDAPRIQGQPVTYNRSGGTSHPPPPPPPPLPPSYLDYTPAQEMQSGALNMSQAHFHYNGNFREFSFVSPQATKQISYYHHHNHQHPPSCKYLLHALQFHLCIVL